LPPFRRLSAGSFGLAGWKINDFRKTAPGDGRRAIAYRSGRSGAVIHRRVPAAIDGGKMRRLAALVLAGLLAACTSVSYDFGDLARVAPRFGDRKPHEWGSRAPWSYPIHGTDVAKYQGRIDWERLKANGIAFAFIKATEGGDRVDDNFGDNWIAARNAGIPRGAYHFFYFCRPAIEQAQWYISHVPRERGALPPVIDMEWNPDSPTCTVHPAPETVRSELKVFADAVTRHYGKRPIIYTTIDFFDDNDLSRLRGVYPFWLRSVAGHPDDKFGGHPWIFWQYTGTGILPGIDGNADINTFNGGGAAWRKWLKANAS
jgi:lysozyme